MLRLRTFGGVVIDGPHGPLSGPASQRRRLAVLVLLSASERGVTRDQLAAYLWPDSSEERAKHALAQLLYGVRRELGEAVLLGDALTVRLNPALISSDVVEFRRAISTHAWEAAADLYTGGFLDGFILNGCAEFERWGETTRTELAHQAREAMRVVATRSAAAGDAARAAAAWRRVALLAPLDSRVALSLMKALVAVEDRTGALEYARVHEALVRQELDATPDPSIVAFVATLKASLPERDSPLPRAASSPLTAVTVDAGGSALRPPPVAGADAAGAAPHESSSRERWGWAAAFVLGLGTLAAIGAVASLRSQPDVPIRWVLIADAQNATGDGALDRTMPVALAAALAQSRQVYPVPPDRVRQSLLRMRRPAADSILNESLAREIAQREGVHVVAVPAAERSGEAFELSVRLIDPATGGVLSLSTERAASRAKVIDALDKLGRDLRGQLGESRFSVARRPSPLPLVTTVSLDALQKFAQGGRAFQSSKLPEAFALWKEAVTLDTAFASAYASLGMLSYWTNRPGEGATYHQKALALAANLPERERLRIAAAAEAWRGNRDSAVALLRPYLASHTHDLDLWNMLGYNYLRMGKFAEAEEVLSRVTSLDTMDYTAFINFATVQKGLKRYPKALGSYRRAFTLDPPRVLANDNVNLEYGSTFIFNHQPDSARAVFMRLLASPDALRQARALRSLAFLEMYEGRFTSAVERLSKAAEMMRVSREGVSEIRNRLLLAQALEQIEPERNVRRQLEQAFVVTTRLDAPVPILLWVGKALARSGDVSRSRAALDALDKHIQRDVRADVAARDILQGEILLAQGQSAKSLRFLRAGFAGDSNAHALESLAFGLAAAGALDSAAARYEELEKLSVFGAEAQNFSQLAAYWIGRVDEERNRPELAREAYVRFINRWAEGDRLPLVVDARARLVRLNPTGR